MRKFSNDIKLVLFNNNHLDDKKEIQLNSVLTIFETCRYFNDDPYTIELIFSSKLSVDENIQISFLVHSNEPFYLDQDFNRVLITDASEKFIVTSFPIKELNLDKKYNFVYYLKNKNRDEFIAKLTLDISQQILISKVLNNIINGNLLHQDDTIHELTIENPKEYIELKYSKGDDINIIGAFFNKDKISFKNPFNKTGTLFIIFTVNQLKEKDKYFLAGIQFTDKDIINKISKNKNVKHFSEFDKFIDKIKDNIINFEGKDVYNISYIIENVLYSTNSSKEDLSKKTPLTKSFYINKDNSCIVIYNYEKFNLLKDTIDLIIEK